MSMEQLWASRKYHVMFHSQKHYNKIRQMMRDGCTSEALVQTIDDALAQAPTTGSQLNAIQHMWGYFKKYATPAEKDAYNAFIAKQDITALLHHLRTLAIRYNVRYLQQSTVLNIDESGNNN